MDGGGVEHLVALGSPEIRLEYGESQVVLLLGCVLLTVPCLEEREVVIRIQEEVVGVLLGTDDLSDDKVGGGISGGDGGGERDEEEERGGKRNSRSHCWNVWFGGLMSRSEWTLAALKLAA